MKTAEGKRFGREMKHWEDAKLIARSGSKTRPVFTLAEHVEAVIS
jgi:hypothetical protein